MKLKGERRTDAYYAVEKPDGTNIQRFDSWQQAYAEAKRIVGHETMPKGTTLDVVRRTYDAFIYRGLARFVSRGSGRYERTI